MLSDGLSVNAYALMQLANLLWTYKHYFKLAAVPVPAGYDIHCGFQPVPAIRPPPYPTQAVARRGPQAGNRHASITTLPTQLSCTCCCLSYKDHKTQKCIYFRPSLFPNFSCPHKTIPRVPQSYPKNLETIFSAFREL